MDDILTEFVSQTQADAALAHDLLEAAEWNLDRALSMYSGFMNTQAVEPEDQISPEMYMTSPIRSRANPDGREEGEGEEGQKEDTLEALEGSFESRRDLLRRKHDMRTARGLSFLAENVVDKFHQVAVSKYRVSSQEQTVIDEQFFRHSFVYPDFSSLEQELQEFIASDLIDVSIKNSLERNDRLNWWTKTGKFPRLEPLATSGDGNCLLHAASLYMWGFHDRFLILRSSMHRLLTQSREKTGIQSRWRYQTQLRNNDAGGLTFSEEEWDFEWSEVVRIATNRPRSEQSAASIQRKSSLRLSYEYLEEIHIFALAHVTQRPIIVIADTTLKGVSGEDLAPIYFGGVYLPLEMNPTACHKSPVVLAYDSAHFSALVAKEEKLQSQAGPSLKQTRVLQGRADRKREEPVIPLVSPDGRLLPIQFVYDPNNPTVEEKWGKMKYEPGEFPPALIRLLENYLNIRWVKLPVVSQTPREGADNPHSAATTNDYDHLPTATADQSLRCPAAQLAQESQPVYQKELVDNYLENVHERLEEEKKRCQRIAEEKVRQEKLAEEARLRQPVPCKGPNCEMFGTLSMDSLCSVCYQRRQNGDFEKEDLTLQTRELDSETVELYMPRIEGERPPSYVEATAGMDEGESDDEQREDATDDRGEGEHMEMERAEEVVSNGLCMSESSSLAVSQRDPPPLPPKPAASIGGEALGYTSSGTSVQSSASEGNGGDKSPKKSKGGWIKKLQALPAGLRSGSKQKKSPTGYSRDNIQPVGSARTLPDTHAALSPRTQCRNGGCEFFGNPNCDGYCSTCYKALETIKASSTVV